MSALDKSCSIFTVVLGRAGHCRLLVGVGVHTVLLKRLKRNSTGLEKGVAPGAAHSKGSPTEARNADAGKVRGTS